MKKRLIGLMILAVLLITACSTAGQAAQDEAATTSMSGSTTATVGDGHSSDDEMMGTPESTSDTTMDESSNDEMSMDAASDDTMMDADHGDDMMAESADDSMMDESSSDGMSMDSTSDDSMMEDDSTGDASMGEAMELPAWFNAQLIDVNSGQSFRIADYEGKVVLVETLAVWCSNCLRQQREVAALHELLGERDDFVSVGLDIDINETEATLREHAANQGFNWVYAVAPRDVAREIGQLYGDQFLNPPSTPMLIIDRHGEAHLLPFGIKSADDLLAALEPFLSESM